MPSQIAPSICLIGGCGRMGRMLTERAAKTQYTLTSLDRPLTEEKIRTGTANAGLVIFCVPALALEDVLPMVCRTLPEDCIVSDITSVKDLPMRLMEKWWPGAVVGTHPLFGPNPESDQDLPVAITQGARADEKALRTVEDFMAALGFRCFRTSCEEHDSAMARIQNLNFITNLAYFAMLAQHKELLPFLTPSFKRRLNASKKMLTEDAPMFSGLFEANPQSQEVVRQFRAILSLAASGDIGLLCEKVQWWWTKENP
ncbi:MAG: prephenate dehydrogenase [Desulfovibrionaceae bacterium]|nr:prephenate dehydrogenase [Desulfovibrionaceae bacterium]